MSRKRIYFTEEEKTEIKKKYRHDTYIRHKEKVLARQKEYYKKHKKEILFRMKNNYRIKCGLKPLVWKY